MPTARSEKHKDVIHRTVPTTNQEVVYISRRSTPAQSTNSNRRKPVTEKQVRDNNKKKNEEKNQGKIPPKNNWNAGSRNTQKKTEKKKQEEKRIWTNTNREKQKKTGIKTNLTNSNSCSFRLAVCSLRSPWEWSPAFPLCGWPAPGPPTSPFRSFGCRRPLPSPPCQTAVS